MSFFLCVAKPETNETLNLGLHNPDLSSVSEIKRMFFKGGPWAEVGQSLDLPGRTLEISGAKNDYFSWKEKVLRSRLIGGRPR